MFSLSLHIIKQAKDTETANQNTTCHLYKAVCKATYLFLCLGFAAIYKKKQLKKKHDGQAQQLSWRDDSHCRRHTVIEHGIIATAVTGT